MASAKCGLAGRTGRTPAPTNEQAQVAACGPGSVGKVGFHTKFPLAVELAVTAQARACRSSAAARDAAITASSRPNSIEGGCARLMGYRAGDVANENSRIPLNGG